MIFLPLFFSVRPIENEVIQEAMHALHLADAEVRFEHFFLVGVGWIFFLATQNEGWWHKGLAWDFLTS